MSKKDFEFLIDLQKRMNEQDEDSQKHDFQASPYFWGVAENKTEWGIEEGYGDDRICFVYNCSEYNTIEECKNFFMEMLDDDVEEGDEEIKEIESISSWREVEDYIQNNQIDGRLVYGRKVEDVISKYTGCFLTKQACKDHIEKYGYNYSEPHTFAMTADRNPEFERVWNILKKTDWKQLAELKAEVERLKKYETIYYLNQLQASNEDINRFKQLQTQQSINVSDLLQQIKEKDEEIERLNQNWSTLCDWLGEMIVKYDDTTFQDVLQKVNEIQQYNPAYSIKSNTKQVCDKIRELAKNNFEFVVCDECYNTVDKDVYISSVDLTKILDQTRATMNNKIYKPKSCKDCPVVIRDKGKIICGVYKKLSTETSNDIGLKNMLNNCPLSWD